LGFSEYFREDRKKIYHSGSLLELRKKRPLLFFLPDKEKLEIEKNLKIRRFQQDLPEDILNF
jgi:hypothetical protein